MHEKIQIKRSRKGTLAMFFNNLISAADAGTEVISYLAVGLDGKPIRLADTEDQARFIRNDRNNFVFDTSVKIITGRTISQTLTQEISLEQQGKLRQNFTDKQFEAFGKDSVSAAFFSSKEVTDFFVSFGIERSVDVLNTLSVHNNLLGETPIREALTGVLFGKLEALQKIKDENGNKVRIPLANVPVAVFTPSEEFPSVSSADEDGNRMTLNLKENSKSGMYFNQQSFETDREFLGDDSAINTVPQKYRHTAFTNERGEFVLFDVPIGEQVFIFEIDLLKQGLTKDEVSLNFFNYPAEESPNVDSVPHFFYRQIPVNVVPSWGDFQSGYTELNVTVPLDLRKWATYYTTPMAFSNVTLQDRQLKGFSTPLTYEIRNMALSGYPLTKRMEVVEIDDLLDKDDQQELMWNNEFKQTKIKAEFRKSDYEAFKLPANLYDPEGIGTNNQKGVWLCAYEFKMRYDNRNIYRATGFERYWLPAGSLERSHFDLNRHTSGSDPATLSATTGVFPYEKAWTINYPEKYSIPKIPSIINSNKTYTSGGVAVDIKEPKWLDGDRVGGPLGNVASSGYGIQNIDGKYKSNIFSQRVTSGTVFKYEKDVRWDEEYSSGYRPVDAKPGQESNVVNGERYQRLEAGFGYWLKPEGWPRISDNNWGDVILSSDFSSSFSPLPGLAPPTYRDVVVKFPGEIIALKLDSTISPSYLQRGSLDIYRVVEPNLLVPPGPPLVDKYANIEFQAIYVQNNNTPIRRLELIIDTNNDRLRYASGEGKMSIKNNGILDAMVLGKRIKVGESVMFDNKISSGMNIVFPGNAAYNSNDNSYDRAIYSVVMTINIPGPSIDVAQIININVATDKNTSINYVTSRVNNTQTKSKIKNNGDVDCSTNDPKIHDVLVDGIVFTASKSNVASISIGSAITATCTNNIPHTIL